MGRRDQLVRVLEPAEYRIDIAVVGDVVTAVVLRGDVEGTEPHGVDTEPREILEPFGDSRQVPDSVAITVRPGPRVDLVNHRVPPPGVRRRRGVDWLRVDADRDRVGHAQSSSGLR